MVERVYKRKAIPKHPAVLWSRINFRWPLLVWLLAVAAAIGIYRNGGKSDRLSGVVEVVRDRITPAEASRLAIVHVKVGEKVKKGDLLAEMDTSMLDAELALERLQLERQFDRAVRRQEEAIRDARIDRASDVAEYEVLKNESERLDELLSRRLIDAQSVARLRARERALATTVEFYPEMLRQLEEDLAKVRAQKAELDSWIGGEGEDAEDHVRNIGFINLRKERYMLKAPRDGMVSRIYHEPGAIVAVGDAVLDIVVSENPTVLAFLPESHARDVAVGAKAVIYKPLGYGEVVRASVSSVSPEILGLPNRISPIRGQTVRGLRVRLTPSGPCDLLPGEGVGIHIVSKEDQDSWFYRIFSSGESESNVGVLGQ